MKQVLKVYLRQVMSLIKFIAKQFKVAKSNVTIEKGELGRHKQLRIVNPQQIPAVVAALIE